MKNELKRMLDKANKIDKILDKIMHTAGELEMSSCLTSEYFEPKRDIQKFKKYVLKINRLIEKLEAITK